MRATTNVTSMQGLAGTAGRRTTKLPLPSRSAPTIAERQRTEHFVSDDQRARGATGAPMTGRRRSICSGSDSPWVRSWSLLVRPTRLASLVVRRPGQRRAAPRPSRSRLPRSPRAVRNAGWAPVGVLDEHPAGGQRQAQLLSGAQRRVDVDPGPQAEPADRQHAVTDEALQAGVQMATEFG